MGNTARRAGGNTHSCHKDPAMISSIVS